jgi:diadenylate cyclase
VLPVSDSTSLSKDLGTRHRAGVGISEVSDTLTVIVSEENGVISVAIGGVLKRYLTPDTLEKLLRNELCPAEQQNKNWLDRLMERFEDQRKESQKE